jgi:tRNA(fMet)-specific endonuclease VapC
VEGVGKGTGKICLDTDIIIDYLRETEETQNLVEILFDRFDEIAITAITAYELLMGVESSNGKDRNRVEAIIKITSILSFDEKAAREAAVISSKLKKSGQRIGIQDEMIAAICKANNVCLLTKNTKHFQRIKELDVIGLDSI